MARHHQPFAVLLRHNSVSQLARICLLLCGLVLASGQFAFADAPPLTITDAGFYLTIVDESGEPSFEKIADVRDLRTSKNPPTNPDNPAPKPPPPGISRDVAKWASVVGDWQDAQRYMLIFEIVRDGIRAGDIPVPKRFEVLSRSADAVLNRDWGEFRDKLSAYFIRDLQDKGEPSKDDAINQIELIRYGLGYAAHGSKPIETSEGVAVIGTVNEIIAEVVK